jgi:hypothetical protein
MLSKLLVLIKREFNTVLISVLVTILGFLLLGIWRFFQDSTFLFTQILIVTAGLGFLIYIITLMLENRVSAVLRSRELAIIVLTFTLLSFFTLNIDRSRSFFLLKWVSESSESGTTLQEISVSQNFSVKDIEDFKQRIQEQKESGTLKEENGQVKVTVLGSAIVTVSRFIAKAVSLNGFLKA